MSELYVDPYHRVPDDQWAEIVRRANEIHEEHLANKEGGASSPAGPLVNMLGSGKHSGVSGLPTQQLVLHSGECPLRGGFAQSLTQWGNMPLDQGGPVASWHWFIDPIARVRMIEEQYAAWHASEANPMSEGFEQSGYARYTRAEWTTPDGMLQMESLAYTMAQRAIANDIPPVWLTTDQVTAITTYGDRATKGFCCHRQIDPETRTDPGDGYPLDLLMEKVKGYMGLAHTTTDQKIEEAISMGKVFLAKTPDNPNVWRCNGMFRVPVWTDDDLQGIRFWGADGSVDLAHNGEIQETHNLNQCGIDLFALVGKDFNGKPVK